MFIKRSCLTLALIVTLIVFLGFSYLVAAPVVQKVAGWVVVFLAVLSGAVGLVGAGAVIVAAIDNLAVRRAEAERLRVEAERLRIENQVKANIAPVEAQHKIALLEAQVRKARREAEIFSIVAGSKVYVSDANPGATWKHLHQMPHWASNGKIIAPTPAELETFRLLHGPRSAAALPPRQPDEAPPPEMWPESIRLTDLLPPGGPTLSKVIFGLSIDRFGRRCLLSASLHKLVHIAVGGATGWGKSVWLLGFMFQIAAAGEEAEIVLIDPQEMTFNALAGSDRLRYQVAAEPPEILGIIDDLEGEMEQRKSLFKQCPRAQKLTDYNRLSNDPLPPIVTAIDEMGTVIKMPGVEGKLKLLVQRCRKYGIYFLSGGPSWKSTDLDTTIRGQYSTRVHFHAENAASSRVLLGSPDAARLDKVGHAYAVLPGHPLTRIMSPFIDYDDVTLRLHPGPGGAPPPSPQAPPPPVVTTARTAQDAEFVRLVREEGLSRRQASRKAYGRPYAGDLVNRGKEALGEI